MGSPRVLAVFAALTALLAGCGHTPERPKSAPATSSSPKAMPPAKAACGDPAALPRREKLAQLLMVGVRNYDDAKAVVGDYHVGGIFIGSWTDLSMLGPNLDKDLSAVTPLPVAVSVDEEGGRVSRLSGKIDPLPSAKMMALTTPDEVRKTARDRGFQMRALGITVDFAPVVDITDPDTAASTVIGDRSFGQDAATVIKFAGAFAQGLHDAGVMPVLKHFPGHGHGSGDSHTGGVVTPPLPQLQKLDLEPYRALVNAVAPQGVMVGHLQVPELTGDEPASLNRAAVQMLRTGTRYSAPPFNGPIFSDDLSSMAAINDHYSVADAVLRTLQAGTDVALWVTTDQVPAVLGRLEKALDAKELKMSDVDDSVRRVAKFKGPKPDCGP
jgi:beta-N-acetylhexosaminidase